MTNYILKFVSIILFLFLTNISFETAAQTAAENTVVGSVGNETVTYKEVKENFSSGEADAPSLSQLEEFLPVYLDFRAKLLAAKDEGYFENPSINEEHKQYAKQAAYAYWLNNEIKPAAFEHYKKRAEVELKTYHILVALPENASEQQEQEAIAKLKEAKEQMQSGVPLNEVNEEYSTVRNGRSMGGDLPWISAGRTVPEFEDTAYNLEVGEVSEPFKTQFGYHIMLLQDKRERTPARFTRHIFVRATNDTAAYNKITEAYDALESGEQWGLVVEEYTEDPPSARNSGRIGWVSYQENFQTDFVDAVMGVDPEASYSSPVQTSYGYHIFRVDSVQTYSSEEARDQELMDQLSNTSYFTESNAFVIDYIKDELPYQEFPEKLSDYKQWVTGKDSTTFDSLPTPPLNMYKVIAQLSDYSFTLSDYHSFLLDRYDNIQAASYRDTWFDEFTNSMVDNNMIEITVDRYPEFEQQSESYLNGLVVYQINDDKVWNPAKVDSTKLKKMYEENPNSYTYSDRPHFYLLTARHDSTLNKAIDFVNNGGSPDSLRANIDRLGVRMDSTSMIQDKPYTRLKSMDPQSFSEIFDYNEGKAVLWLQQVLPARQMTFKEAFNRIFSEYQPQREQEWLEELRDKYNVQPHFDKLRTAYRQDS
ncbi:MAG: peptidylprolyl isomerase [Gracilimonas sp.]|nr:peptidylprolyl isomerase [Gracilimonas sp.]